MKYGLCCISLNLQDVGHKYQTMTRKKFLSLTRDDALKIIGDKTLNNVNTLYHTINYCIKNNWNLRISSDLIPLITLPQANFKLSDLPNYNNIMSVINDCKQLINTSGLRCSTHPDQFVVLASDKPEVVNKSILELNNHAILMDLLGLPQNYNAPINIHINTFKNGNISDIAKRFIAVYKSLQPNVLQRLVVENEDKPNSWKIGRAHV